MRISPLKEKEVDYLSSCFYPDNPLETWQNLERVFHYSIELCSTDFFSDAPQLVGISADQHNVDASLR